MAELQFHRLSKIQSQLTSLLDTPSKDARFKLPKLLMKASQCVESMPHEMIRIYLSSQLGFHDQVHGHMPEINGLTIVLFDIFNSFKAMKWSSVERKRAMLLLAGVFDSIGAETQRDIIFDAFERKGSKLLSLYFPFGKTDERPGALHQQLRDYEPEEQFTLLDPDDASSLEQWKKLPIFGLALEGEGQLQNPVILFEWHLEILNAMEEKLPSQGALRTRELLNDVRQKILSFCDSLGEQYAHRVEHSTLFQEARKQLLLSPTNVRDELPMPFGRDTAPSHSKFWSRDGKGRGRREKHSENALELRPLVSPPRR